MESHLLQMRGLKLNVSPDRPKLRESHLLQMRGLKPLALTGMLNKMEVASFTDAWIETNQVCCIIMSYIVASFTDAWIETKIEARRTFPIGVASFTDAWIETCYT